METEPGGFGPAPPPSEVGGRYRLGLLLGMGAYGRVHQATDTLRPTTHVHHQVAVKVTGQPQSGRRERILLEWAQVPGVVRLLDEGPGYVVMPILAGTPFPGRGGRGVAHVRAVLVRLLETVARVHMLGLVHCDLKPSNVLVDGVQPTVLDFGVASTPGRAPVGMTLDYAAPEQLQKGGRPGPQADVFAVGLMTLGALAGGIVWSCGQDDARGAAHLLVERHVADPDLRTALIGMLQPDPERRASALDALALLGAPAGRPLPSSNRSATTTR